jgi:ABC-type nitrate/sulfonate/bicarbonate transport system permease component
LPEEVDDKRKLNGVVVYWLVIVAVAVAWMLVTHRDDPGPVVADHPPTHRTTLSQRWNRTTGTPRVAIVAMAFGKTVWVGLVLATLVAVTIGTATWMY